MDLRTRRIDNDDWIITAWIAGLVYTAQSPMAPRWAVFFFLVGLHFPILALYILFYFHMPRGRGRYQTPIVCWRLSRCASGSLKCMIVSFLSGAVLSIGIISRLRKFTAASYQFFNYFQLYFTNKRNTRKKLEPGSLLRWEGCGWSACPFFRSVLMGVLPLD